MIKSEDRCEEGQSPYDRKRPWYLEALTYLVIIAAVMVISLVIRQFVISPYQIPTASMEPTIEIGDCVFAEKVSLTLLDRMPKRGEIVTFVDEREPDITLIKRVIGTPGDVIDFQEGKLLVNGKIMYEDYTHGKDNIPLDPAAGVEIKYPYTVPADSLWVMGDNRTNSADSRYFGPVAIKDVNGVAVMRYWPLDRFGAIK